MVGTEYKVQGVVEHRTQGREMLATLVVSWQASEVRGEKAGRFRKVAGMSIIAAGCLRSTVDTVTVDSPTA